jgi:hypothetical protein
MSCVSGETDIGLPMVLIVQAATAAPEPCVQAFVAALYEKWRIAIWSHGTKALATKMAARLGAPGRVITARSGGSRADSGTRTTVFLSVSHGIGVGVMVITGPVARSIPVRKVGATKRRTTYSMYEGVRS